MKYKYKSTIDPFKNTTEISILNNRGHKYMTVEIYGQLTESAVRSYAIDMLQILSKKGVIKWPLFKYVNERPAPNIAL